MCYNTSMIFKLLLMVLALLIVVFLTIVNLLVIIVSIQSEIHQTKQKIDRAIISYLDLIPQFIKESELQNTDFLNLRSQYFAKPSWQLYLNLSRQAQSKLSSSSDSKINSELVKRHHIIQALVHEYNSQVIQYNNKLEKQKYRLIKYLDFRYGQRKYELLDS